MLRSGRLPESDLGHGLRVIDKNSQALSRLINDLLDMSSIMSGKMKIVREPVGLASALGEAARPCAAGESGRVAPKRSWEGPHIEVSARTRLVPVFGTVNNAVKFSREAGRRRASDARPGTGAGRGRFADEGRLPATPAHVSSDSVRRRSTTRAHGGLGIGIGSSELASAGGEVRPRARERVRKPLHSALPALAAAAPRAGHRATA